MSAVRPRAAAPPIILTAFEATPLDLFAAVLAEGLVEELELDLELELDGEEVEAGEVADEAAGDVTVAGVIEEVKVTPAARHVCWATCSACARSAPLQLASKHCVVETTKVLSSHRHLTSPDRQDPRLGFAKHVFAQAG
jgi:hypothetical protein